MSSILLCTSSNSGGFPRTSVKRTMTVIGSAPSSATALKPEPASVPLSASGVKLLPSMRMSAATAARLPSVSVLSGR